MCVNLQARGRFLPFSGEQSPVLGCEECGPDVLARVQLGIDVGTRAIDLQCAPLSGDLDLVRKGPADGVEMHAAVAEVVLTAAADLGVHGI